MALTLRRTKGSQLTWDEVDENWVAGRAFTGTVTLAGEATAYDDLLMPLVQGKQGALDKPAWDATNLGYLFPNGDATQILFLNCQFPHRWLLGSRVYPHVHWHQAANQVPVFKIDYKWIEIGEAVPANWSTYTMGTAVKTYPGSGTIHQLNAGAAGIDGTGFGLSSIMQIKLYRDDTVYTGNALATSFDIHIEIDSFGSNEEYIK